MRIDREKQYNCDACEELTADACDLRCNCRLLKA